MLCYEDTMAYGNTQYSDAIDALDEAMRHSSRRSR